MKELIINMLKVRFVTKSELIELFHLSDRSIRALVQQIKKDYPVISTSNKKGWKIATNVDDLPFVEDSLRNNRAKAITILEGQKQLKLFCKSHKKTKYEQLTFEL